MDKFNNPEKQQRSRNPLFALAYAAALPTLRTIAREHGYALAVHGSMATDLDLVAVPWVEHADSAEDLIKSICEATGGCAAQFKRFDDNPSVKPHGRRAWAIYLIGDKCEEYVLYLDISVLPRVLCEKPDYTHEET